uniref:uncharacterized protein LOC122604652 n=1 Tax=Erigeron canadensis TaxID=72917 RepID=UPI001CB8CA9B|nr:uncharacterized protein LOC122604652 [Erigeron canadensis]
MVTNEGIHANPEKIQAIVEMASPKTLRDVQTLNGRLAALGRFLAKSAERSLPFFKTLKGCLNKKDFKWSREAESAFQELKSHLQSLPALTVPRPGETLILYLAAAKEAINAVLLAERQNVQKPVHFVSRALQGLELNYPNLEKSALALVNVARRLRRYFQAHTICVLIDQPIRQVLLKPENSRRLAKWAVELGEHEIIYKPRTSLKGQVLADFLAESPTITHNNQLTDQQPSRSPNLTWTLFTDGASSIDGSRAGLILTDPDGQEITDALRFNFKALNTEAEYEALIAGLELAIQMETKHLHVYTDSLLVVNQVNGEYTAREEVMQKYLKKVTVLRKSFNTFIKTQVPRSKNKQADALSKLASSSFTHLTKNLLVEIVPRRSIEVKLVSSAETVEGTWMNPIIDYLKNGTLPDDHSEARKIRIKAPQYSIKQEILYKKGYLTPWLRCVTSEEANYVLQESHFGSCGSHAGARSIAQKAARLGYFWPTMYCDATKLVQICENCQRHAPIIHQLQQDLTSISSPWPFYQWGIDIVGPFPMAPGKVRFLVVAIDYFTKWAEAEPLATITGQRILKFVWRNIVCRFGIP